MKVGILTYHRSQNYGAFLQAKALQDYVQSLGNDTYVIDYWPDYHAGMYSHFYWPTFKKHSFAGKLVYIGRCLLTYIPLERRQRNTRKVVEECLRMTHDREFDVVLYGSDQIWRKQYGFTDDFDPVYFGDEYVSAKYRISYAASMGKMAINTDSDRLFFKEALNRFDAISVREKSLQDLIVNDFSTKATLVCDPVLLLSKNQWLQFVDERYIPKYKYILYYRLASMRQTDEIVDELAKKTGYKVIEMRGYMPLFYMGQRYRMTANAQEFLSLISRAEYVVTSSFHGLAFSLIMERQFLCTCTKDVSVRQRTLLSIAGLDDRFVEDSDIAPLLEADIDYSIVTPRLQSFSDFSRNWLKEQLEGCGKRLYQ